MSKKQKRNISSATIAESTAKPGNNGSAPAPVFNRFSTTVEFNPDYSYVIKDLKRIGALAGSFFVILIALSFILK